MSDSRQQAKSNLKRSSSELRAASSDLGIIGLEQSMLCQLRLSKQHKTFFSFDSKALSADKTKLDLTLKNSFSSGSWETPEPKSVICGIYSPNFSLIPASLFEVNQPFPKIEIDRAESSNIVLNESLSDLDVVIQYQLDEDIYELIQKYAPNAQLKFMYSGWLIAMQLASRQKEHFVAIHSTLDHMAIAVFKNSRLQLFNTFPKKSTEDVSYFGLYAIQELDIPSNNCHLILSAPDNERSKLQEVFNRYLYSLNLALPKGEFNASSEGLFNANYPLTNLYLCV